MKDRTNMLLLIGAAFLSGAALMYGAGDYREKQERKVYIDRITDWGLELAERVAPVAERRYINGKGIDDGQAPADVVMREVERQGGRARVMFPSDQQRPAGERVTQLPEDGASWHTTLFTSNDWRERPDENMVVAAFYTDASLTRLRQQTNWNHYTPDNRLWKSYSSVNRVLPSVVVQDPEGAVVFKSSGAAMNEAGATPVRSLAKSIAAAIRRHCPRCPLIRPQPKPDPEPKPDEQPVDPAEVPEFAPIPDILPLDPAPAPQQAGVALPLGIGAIAVAIAVASGWRQRTTI